MKRKTVTRTVRNRAEYVRDFIFGVEDSLVSTVGLVSGIAAVGTPTKTIVITGMVLIFVEAFSMGVGELLSENVVEEYEDNKAVPLGHSLRYAGVMFVSYLLSGFMVISPYLFTSSESALGISVAASLLGLAVLGVFSARFAHVSVVRKALTMVLVGGVTIALGVVVGTFINYIR